LTDLEYQTTPTMSRAPSEYDRAQVYERWMSGPLRWAVRWSRRGRPSVSRPHGRTIPHDSSWGFPFSRQNASNVANRRFQVLEFHPGRW